MTGLQLAALQKPTKGKNMEKKKVYVETTVVSDATALPSKDLILAARQIISREWLETAKLKYSLY